MVPKCGAYFPLCKVFIRLHLEYCVHFFPAFFQKDKGCLEKLQLILTRMTEVQGQKTYEQKLLVLGVILLEIKASIGSE